MKQRLTYETHEYGEQEGSLAENQETEASLTFQSAEAMIRHDAEQNFVPPQIRDRLMQSVDQEFSNIKPTPWWKRWMPF